MALFVSEGLHEAAGVLQLHHGGAALLHLLLEDADGALQGVDDVHHLLQTWLE